MTIALLANRLINVDVLIMMCPLDSKLDGKHTSNTNETCRSYQQTMFRMMSIDLFNWLRMTDVECGGGQEVSFQLLNHLFSDKHHKLDTQTLQASMDSPYNISPTPWYR
ncbi:predicted protein [Sclerotinia sclerotiorum 1980 UF-70]|uniref:Uncharacterized protein n=1 Tax=Sclerotinia sclerotiorum (strain ATCC 18683 / 1980 / Ss-1) TaxID=665079 RepID=A7F862_SCLS1|nr:predicted protein [Sclerotinia sclerotiorum 1980 UF-70]EDN98933.1 predicted protein [Sclerotinia sclerotiorum 1980 UF-70]